MDRCSKPTKTGKPCVWFEGHEPPCAPENGQHVRYGPGIGRPDPKPRLVKKPRIQKDTDK